MKSRIPHIADPTGLWKKGNWTIGYGLWAIGYRLWVMGFKVKGGKKLWIIDVHRSLLTVHYSLFTVSKGKPWT
jgi:hypothetical protein